jgi:SAM-dependent methyltransferase
VLDAGCSKGNGLIAMAAAQPDVTFVGCDVNPVALDLAKAEAERRGLQNVTLAEVDLETLAGLPAPARGYDVIVCSGVLHHLLEPEATLRALAARLAPWGVLDLMVYAREGRVGLERVASEVAELVPRDLPWVERILRVRSLAADRADDAAWAEIPTLPDTEVADRYLHPQFVSYTLPELAALCQRAGLPIVAPTDRSRTLGGGTRPLRTHDVLLSRCPPRSPGDPAAAGWALNAEGELREGTRTLWSGPRATGHSWHHPSRDRDLALAAMPAAAGAAFLASIGRPFWGSEFARALATAGVAGPDAARLLVALEAHDVIWRPQIEDLRARTDMPTLRAN